MSLRTPLHRSYHHELSTILPDRIIHTKSGLLVYPIEISIGPILDDRLKEKLLKPWKGAHSSHFRVCLCVRTRATGHTFWPENLIFRLNDPWDMRKKTAFLFFEIFIFTLFIGIFRFFSLYNTSKFLVSSYRDIWVERTLRNWRRLIFCCWKCHVLRLRG